VRDLPQQVINSLPVQAPCQKKENYLWQQPSSLICSNGDEVRHNRPVGLMTSVLCGDVNICHTSRIRLSVYFVKRPSGLPALPGKEGNKKTLNRDS